MTDYLGFRPFHDEWKVMGLSAYGSDRFYDDFKELVHLCPDGSLRLDLKYFSFHTHGRSRWHSEAFVNRFGPSRAKNEDVNQRACDIAFAVQRVTEDVVLKTAKWLREETGANNLVVAGGVALNCLMNQKLAEEGGVRQIFIQPLAHDAGTSLGSALYYTHSLKGLPREHVFDGVYLGPHYSDNEIERDLNCAGIHYHRSSNVAREVAAFIAEGKIAGWFQGRMECGPRALGNRSILADPRDAGVREVLNLRIKKREWFRPFAPAVLSEYADDYFELVGDSSYMVITSNVKSDKRGVIPAVTHKDGTARVQVVRRDANPTFWHLIEEFRLLTGVPVLLNTSFNENEPIVMHPKEAIACFQRTGFDVLGIGSFVAQQQSGPGIT